MESLRSWVTGITVCAILSALARALTARSAARDMIRLFSGVCVALAVLAPLRQGLPASLLRSFEEAHILEGDAVLRGQALGDELTRRYAAEQAAAYIEAQLSAAAPGVRVSITLSAALEPVCAELRGPPSSRENAVALTASALGLGADRILFIAEEENDENEPVCRMDGATVA